jgi:release factor glutamine methyltransferase
LADSSSIGAVLADANKKLHAISHSARLDAELLLARAIDMPRSYLFAHPDELLDAAAVDRFNRAIQRRQGGEPMAYIIGVKEFWSLPLMVSPATLVPRPETELLVEQALLRIPRKTPRQVLDLGTGSGAIALAIAKERPLCDVIATDISEEALAIAMLNAQYLELPNIRFLHGDWTTPVAGHRFDIVVSNPPYVETGDPALHELRHEPQTALTAGSDGLDAIRRISTECVHVIKKSGTLLLEHGATQAEDVAAILVSNDWRSVECICDLSATPRITIAGREFVSG